MKKLIIMLLVAVMLTLPAAQATEIGGGLTNNSNSGAPAETPAEQPEEAPAAAENPGMNIGGGLFGTDTPAATPTQLPEDISVDVTTAEATYVEVQAEADWYVEHAVGMAVEVSKAATDASYMDMFGPGGNSAVVNALRNVDFTAPAAVYSLRGGSREQMRSFSKASFNIEDAAALAMGQWDAFYVLDSASYNLDDEAVSVADWTGLYSAYIMPAGFIAQIVVLEYDCCCVCVQFIDGSDEAVIVKALIMPTSAEHTIDDIFYDITSSGLYDEPVAME